MSTSPIHLPPIVTPITDLQTGLPTIEQAMWQQQLLLSRSPWIAYKPTTGNVSAITANDCAFCQLGKFILVRIGINGTTNGTAFTVTLPFKAKSVAQAFAAQLAGFAATVGVSAVDFITLTVSKYDNTTPVNGTVVFWIISGAYEAQ